jgi:3-hydroxyisobutyrate dehydrogenase-like beta-hydroxyacid dehydrogenase
MNLSDADQFDAQKSGEVATYAVLGTGLMGAAVARALAAHGQDVVAWNRTYARAHPLEADGVRVSREISAALEQAGAVLVVLLDHEAALQALKGHEAALSGKTIINLMTGTPAQSDDFAALADRVGAEYLDGAILSYPSAIGAPDTIINVSGSLAAWETHADALRAVAGGSKFVGQQPGAANVLDAAMTGVFHCVALGALVEALSFLDASGVDIAGPGVDLDYWMDLVRAEAHKIVAGMSARDFATEESTLAVYLAGTQQWRGVLEAAGQRATLLSALIEKLDVAVQAGHGEEGFIAQWKTAGRRATANEAVAPSLA